MTGFPMVDFPCVCGGGGGGGCRWWREGLLEGENYTQIQINYQVRFV